MTPRLTVITICRNVRAALERTAASVLAASDPRIEYRIVDGGSTDGTAATLAVLAAQGVQVVSEPDRGISDAMNKGVRLAHGDWVAHLHADDTYLPGALARVLEEIERDDADVLCGWMIKAEDTGDILCRCDPRHLRFDMALNHPSTFVRRSLFEQHGGFDTTLKNAMDYDFFLRVFLTGARFRVLPFAVSRMAAGGQSERSLWKTLAETHVVRRRRLRSGPTRSSAYLWMLYAKGSTRIALQKAGFNRFVRWWRRRLAWPPKG
jgi:glycosyltransferase involved in cell wall biosynthesis